MNKRNGPMVIATVLNIVEAVLLFILMVTAIVLEVLTESGIEFTAGFLSTIGAGTLRAILISTIVVSAIFLCITVYCSLQYLANCARTYEQMHEKVAPLSTAVVLNYVRLGIVSASLALAGASRKGEKVKKEKVAKQQPPVPPQQPPIRK